MELLNDDTVGELFSCVLKHLKCIEVRIEYAKAVTSQKQKYALGSAVKKVQGAVNQLCDLLPNSESTLSIKKELDAAHLVYVMLLTEQLYHLKEDDLEEIVILIENHINNKYQIEQS